MWLILAATATGFEVKKSEAEIIALAKHATSRYCEDRSPVIGGYYRVRCSFIAHKDDGEWLVVGHPIYENTREEEVIVEGGDVVLHYSSSGQLLRHEGAKF